MCARRRPLRRLLLLVWAGICVRWAVVARTCVACEPAPRVAPDLQPCFNPWRAQVRAVLSSTLEKLALVGVINVDPAAQVTGRAEPQSHARARRTHAFQAELVVLLDGGRPPGPAAASTHLLPAQ